MKQKAGKPAARRTRSAAPTPVESRFRAVFENSRDAIGISKEGVHVFVNPAYLQLFGFPPGTDLAGKPVLDLIAPSRRGLIADNIRRRVGGEDAPPSYETRALRDDGTEFDMEVTVSQYREGADTLTLAVLRDITARKATESALAEREMTLRQIMDTADVAIFLVDRTGRITHANRRMAQMFGCPPEELLGSEYVARVHPSEREVGRQKMLALLASSIPAVDLERLYWRKDGSEFWGHLAGRRFQDARGNEVGLIGVITDIDQRKRAERAIHETSELLTRFLRHSPIYAYIKEVTPGESRVLHVSENFERMIGIPSSDMAGKTMAELFPPEFAAKITADDWAVVSGGKVLQQQEELGGRSYTTIKFPIELGGRTLLAGYTIDITERRQTEALRQESEARYRLLFESANDGIFILDESGFIDCNQRGAEMYGLTTERIFGRSPGEFAPERQPDGRLSSEVAAEKTRAAINGVPPQFEWRSLRADGTSFDVEITLSRFELGGKACLIAIVRDIGDRRRAERELLNAQRLESIGTLAGGIAHDFNNLLQGVFGYISMARIAHGQREKSLAMLEQAEKALHQAVGLTSQLLTFAKGGKPLKKVIPLRPVLEDAVKFALSGSRTGYELSLPDDLSRVDADAGQIGQVIQNIVLNADQAMPLGGRIALSARNVAAASVAGLPAGLTGDLVEIAIRDEGTGIPPEHLARIFDPYFTTKDKGSGLGLATSYSIVNSHGGAISVASEFGKGSTFIIRLPAAALPPEQPQPHEAPAADRRLRVLVMDDEQIILNVAGEVLSALGHEAEFAENGEAAIAAYQGARAAGRPFDAVILDLTIRGGLGGVETIRELLKIDPAVKAVVSSGYSEDTGISSYIEHGFKQFLKKPYSVADLRRVLNSLA